MTVANPLRTTISVAVVVVLFAIDMGDRLAAQAAAQSAMAASARTPLRPYDALDEASRRDIPRAVYDSARQQTAFDILALRYQCPGAAVTGVLIRPKHSGRRRWPAIVYNRGGTGDVGRLDDPAVAEMYLLAKSGFVVIASDYRFHGAQSKRDEWGGADVEDVMGLFPLLRSDAVVDTARLFMLGAGRGGTMAYLALQRGAPVKAAAVIAGPSDLEALGHARPSFVNGDDAYDGWARVWPDYIHRAAEHYRARSAVYWADQITVPMLLLHAKDDQVVPVDQALRMAAALETAGRRYDLQVFLNDGHSLSRHRDERNREIVRWFNAAASE